MDVKEIEELAQNLINMGITHKPLTKRMKKKKNQFVHLKVVKPI